MNPRLSAAIAAAITIGVAAILPLAWRLPFAGALLILTAGIYIGGALAINQALGWQFAQATVLGVLVAGAFLLHPLLMGVAWLLHPGWDLLHRKHLPTGLPKWVVPWCLVYDVVIGVACLGAVVMGWA